MVVNFTPVSAYSDAAQRENASIAALEAIYAEKRGALVSTPMEEILMTWPRRRRAMDGSTASVRRSAPK